MATNCVPGEVVVEELTEADVWEIFDSEARRVLHMSGAEFEERWNLGKFASDEDPRVTRVAMLMPGAW